MSSNYIDFNISFLVTALVVYVLLLIIQLGFFSTGRIREKLFTNLITTGLFAGLSQFSTVEVMRFYQGPEGNTIAMTLIIVEFFFTVTMAICFYNFVAECAGVRGKREYVANIICLTAGIFVIIYNLLVLRGVVRAVGSASENGRIPILFYAVPMLIYFYGTFIIVDNREKFRKKMFFAVLTFLLFPVAAGIVQYFMPSQLLMVYGSAMSTLILFFEMEIPDFEKLTEARISLEKSGEEEKKAKEEAIKANEAKNEFLANASMDLKKPIAEIVTLDEMLLRGRGQKETAEYALKIRTTAEDLRDLVSDILIYSKLESGKLEIQSEEYNLAEMIQEIYMKNLHAATGKGIDLLTDISEDIPMFLYGDRRRIARIIKNLVDNAVSFTDSGEVTLRVKVLGKTALSDREKISLRFEVVDTGTGIKDEDLDRLFVAFDKLEIKGAYSSEGAGLGLCIAYSLLKLMGSRLVIESTFGVGSRMYFDLEQEVAGSDTLGSIDEYISERKIKYIEKDELFAPKAKILVVDDAEINLFVVKKFLQPTKINVTTASSGKECLEAVKKESFDLILMDHMMPEMDGIETRQRMSFIEGRGNIPVVAMTACSSADEKKMFLELGFNDFLAKPINRDDLIGMLKRLLPDELKEDQSHSFGGSVYDE
ncbi:MAG: response regulator [Lachnospiraceae bacterium]|nr:response regulator [Lachnospiraceae bacterium]